MGTRQRVIHLVGVAVCVVAFSGCSNAIPNLKAAVGYAVGDITVEVYVKKAGNVIKKYLCGYDYQAEVPINCKEVAKE